MHFLVHSFSHQNVSVLYFVSRGMYWLRKKFCSEQTKEADKKGKLPRGEEIVRAQMERAYRKHKVVTYNKVTEFKARLSPLVSSLLLSCSRSHTDTHIKHNGWQRKGLIPFLWADIKISVAWPRQPTERTLCRLQYFLTPEPRGQEDSVAHAQPYKNRETTKTVTKRHFCV